MTPEHIQRAADAEESAAATRYQRQRSIVELVDDAARRADAMSRLDAWLELSPDRRTRAS